MTALSTIPGRFHAALAGARVEVRRLWSGSLHPLLAISDDGTCHLPGALWSAPDALTLPPTDHNVRALAVVLAAECGLDVRGGALARFDRTWLGGVALNVSVATPNVRGFSDSTFYGLPEQPAAGCGRHVPALANIDPTAPDALFRALVAALCALETA